MIASVESSVAKTQAAAYAIVLLRAFPMFKVIAMSSGMPVSGNATRELSAYCGVDIQASHVRRGVPRTGAEWTALVKIASGELDVPCAQWERLVELGLVQRAAGVPVLTQHGRMTLGLPE
jgi:hypothetical protein